MNKINGYTEEEAKTLVEYISEGKRAGKTLTALFSSYGERHGRARGSVRNYYYALMKNPKGDERVKKLLEGKELSVEQIKEFTEEETDKILRDILKEKSKGVSVRKAIFNLSAGDDKLMLRLQNKYRNVLKKQPEKIEAIAKELGVGLKTEKVFLQRRLESEINALYDRLTQSLKAENTRLFEENAKLKRENEGLKRRFEMIK
ncbi:MAG: hypothetical protein IIX01_03145 [Clostridia bacterium]|nr:hypothetical protein [Clostridia bacterium]